MVWFMRSTWSICCRWGKYWNAWVVAKWVGKGWRMENRIVWTMEILFHAKTNWIFRILLIAWSMNLLISPSLESVRAYCHPSSINYCSIAGIFSAGLVGIVSVPIWGVYGAALIPLSAQLVFLLTGHIFMRNELKKEIGKESERIGKNNRKWSETSSGNAARKDGS